MFRLRDFEYYNRTVFLRVDLNSPMSNGKIISDARFRAVLPTIKYLIESGAKVVVGTHQGKPYSEEYSTTEEHARILSELLNMHVEYVEDIFGKYARERIKAMKPGEVIVLENLRFSAEEVKNATIEECEKTFFVRKLSQVIDLVVNDAFAAAHRSQPSLVGFARIKPMIMGFLMEKEVDALTKAYESEEKPRVYVLGGAKVDDSLKVAENVLRKEKADLILTGGLVGQLFTLAKGFDLGRENIKFLEKKGILKYVDWAEKILDEFYPYVRTPVDFAIDFKGERVEIDLLSDEKRLFDEYPILDIGSRTVEKYREILLKARIIVANGPMGVFEREEFAVGTIGVFKAIGESPAFSVIGGGHSIASIYKYNITGISHISTGGGAMLTFFAGEKLPVLEALKISYEKFSNLLS
ncbi:phosphoglycerate kinase [Pyrococcus furiosus DSM 3638]|uniref:Phosphoglycerate kinase n=4 Tax=Pyrococcus TaxID=2260 RepID=PGK_PYRFU|nr:MULTISPECIES: phosphoglycerate kinase [Pyrococcus]P61883.1 RecName: Full=Phosphoglycerate kinase [Pyrococcus furiosus DSM 3638]P61884.1 RecName: Full=Phosphoglycerate kinase [Pyrococcus woesei]AAL81181.1 phosphoglycerate kinase [Pyrococcus furiosus DSM 3638]AFN03853.1 phosphoglycerate kinase [Pyrococcus furiosus COM1]MDK2868818.1 phosphoglycerate kinase [Pyrococcus sp.]QEK78718.1 phosphoglycerate kinase [Pyrococcus furiosus DSM 3638]CAA51930.1 phosphoglycerate kinase [Pyrococcus woesei]